MARHKRRKNKPKKVVSTKHEEKVHTKIDSSWYDKNYKKLLIIPFVMLLAAFFIIGLHYYNTGDVLNKGITLKGGSSITLTSSMVDVASLDVVALENELKAAFPHVDISTRLQRQFTEIVAVDITVDITDQADLDAFQAKLIELVPSLDPDEIRDNFGITGSVLGQTFFSQIVKAMIISFILMGIVVFIQFRVPTPSLAVILAAFSDIVVTLATVDLLGIKLSTAGIAAFLMLIGYSVDTDILLSTKTLKSKEGSLNHRIFGAFKTGMMMNLTTLAAVTVGLLFSESETITQIMTILFIGLIADMINTWLQNVGILKMYVERKNVQR